MKVQSPSCKNVFNQILLFFRFFAMAMLLYAVPVDPMSLLLIAVERPVFVNTFMIVLQVEILAV